MTPDEIRALTVKQPLDYLAGCLAGDAYLSLRARSSWLLGLHVADEDFAAAFADAINAGYGVQVFRVRRLTVIGASGCQRDLFAGLATYHPTAPDGYATSVRGFFDSEGNALSVCQA